MSSERDQSALEMLLDALREVGGEEAVSAVRAVRGGRDVSIPFFPREEHWLSQAIGFEKASAVCARLRVTDRDGRYLGFPTIYLPVGSNSLTKRAMDVARGMLLAGHSLDATISTSGLSERTVRRIRRQLDTAGELAARLPGGASS